MLLRRFGQSLKEQNWTAIAVEFVLLIAGGFLGIQAANWNEERTERALVRGHLTEIAQDLRTHETVGEDGVVMDDGPAIVDARDVGCGQHGHHAGTSQTGVHFQPKAGQQLDHTGAGTVFLKRGFGVAVKVMAPGLHGLLAGPLNSVQHRALLRLHRVHKGLGDHGGRQEHAGIGQQRDDDNAPAQAAEGRNIFGQRQTRKGQHGRNHGQKADLARHG